MSRNNAKQITTRLPIEETQSLVKGFEVAEAPKGHGESRVYIDNYEDIKGLETLILACYDAVVSGD